MNLFIFIFFFYELIIVAKCSKSFACTVAKLRHGSNWSHESIPQEWLWSICKATCSSYHSSLLHSLVWLDEEICDSCAYSSHKLGWISNGVARSKQPKCVVFESFSVESWKLVVDFVALAKEITDIEPIHSEEHVLKGTEVEEPPCKLFISRAYETDYLIVKSLLLSVFIQLYQPIFDKHRLVVNLIKLLLLLWLAVNLLSLLLLLSCCQGFLIRGRGSCKCFIFCNLGLLKSLIDSANHKLQRAWLIVFDVNSTRASRHHRLGKLPIVIDVAHHRSGTLLGLLLHHFGANHDILLHKLFEPFLLFLALLCFRYLICVQINFKLL